MQLYTQRLKCFMQTLRHLQAEARSWVLVVKQETGEGRRPTGKRGRRPEVGCLTRTGPAASICAANTAELLGEWEQVCRWAGEVTADRKRSDTSPLSSQRARRAVRWTPARSTAWRPSNAPPPFWAHFFLQVTSLPEATRELQISGFDTEVVQKQVTRGEKSWESWKYQKLQRRKPEKQLMDSQTEECASHQRQEKSSCDDSVCNSFLLRDQLFI